MSTQPSAQPYAFTGNRILALLALIITVVVLIFYFVGNFGFEKTIILIAVTFTICWFLQQLIS